MRKGDVAQEERGIGGVGGVGSCFLVKHLIRRYIGCVLVHKSTTLSQVTVALAGGRGGTSTGGGSGGPRT